MNGRWRALARLFMVQGAWNYERMLGVGMGYAAEPLLADLAEADPSRHSEAVVRSAEFFNCHPYLAGLALGASVRAEYDQVPGPQVARLRTALCSPLGALGDQLFWTGVLPAVVAGTLLALALGAGAWIIALAVLGYLLLRMWTGHWALRTGLETGMQVGRVISDSWLPRAARRVGPVAGLLVGLMVPVTGDALLRWAPARGVWLGLGTAVLGVLLSLRFRHTVTAVRFGLVALTLVLVWRWIVS